MNKLPLPQVVRKNRVLVQSFSLPFHLKLEGIFGHSVRAHPLVLLWLDSCVLCLPMEQAANIQKQVKQLQWYH